MGNLHQIKEVTLYIVIALFLSVVLLPARPATAADKCITGSGAVFQAAPALGIDGNIGWMDIAACQGKVDSISYEGYVVHSGDRNGHAGKHIAFEGVIDDSSRNTLSIFGPYAGYGGPGAYGRLTLTEEEGNCVYDGVTLFDPGSNVKDTGKDGRGFDDFNIAVTYTCSDTSGCGLPPYCDTDFYLTANGFVKCDSDNDGVIDDLDCIGIR